MTSGKITTAPRLVSEHLIKKENKHQIMNVHTKWNCPFCLVWSCITCFSPENVSSNWPIMTSGKITTAPRLVSEHLIKKENKHQIMNVHTKWNCPFCLVWSCITCFSPENVSSNWPIMTSGKITTAPRLVSEYLIKKENKHQIMNVHIKWNCLIPILSSLVMYYLFQP